MTADDYRRMALGLDGAFEAEHMGHPDFRVGGKIFATLQHGLRTAAVMLSPEEQARFVAEAPAAFMPESGAWGRAGSTRIQLAEADEELVGEALTLAWRRRIALSAASKPGRATPRAATARKVTARKVTARKKAALPAARARKAATKR